MPIPVPAALVALPSSSSGLVSVVSFIYIKILGGLGAGSIVYLSGLGEIIGGPATHSVESSPCCTTHQNSSKLMEGILYLWEHHHLADLKLLVYVVLPPIEFLLANVFSSVIL